MSAYVGKRPCGHIAAAVFDDPERPKATAEAVAEFIESGMTVERVSDQHVRDNFATRCEDCRRHAAAQRDLWDEAADVEAYGG